MSLFLDFRPRRYPTQQVGLSLTPTTPIAMPDYLQSVIDPNLGNKITRLTEKTVMNPTGSPLRMVHQSTLFTPWNADESRLFLVSSRYDEGFLLNGQTGKHIRTVSIPFTAGAGFFNAASWRWSHVNPDNFFGVQDAAVCNTNNTLMLWHPKSAPFSSPTVLHTFSQFDDKAVTGVCPNMSFANNSDLAWNDSLGVVMGWSSARSSWGWASFKIVNPESNTPTIEEIATYWLGEAGGASNAQNSSTCHSISATPNGDGIIVGWGTVGAGPYQGTDWYSQDFSVRKHLTNSNSHAAMGFDADGRQFYITACGGNCTGVGGAGVTPMIVGYGMDSNGPTGEARILYYYQLNGLGLVNDRIHISCQNVARRGWCYVSDFQQINDAKQYGYKLIYALALDGSFRVEPITINHGSANTDQTSNNASAQGLPSKDGGRVLFKSDWGVEGGDVNLFMSEIVHG